MQRLSLRKICSKLCQIANMESCYTTAEKKTLTQNLLEVRNYSKNLNQVHASNNVILLIKINT